MKPPGFEVSAFGNSSIFSRVQKYSFSSVVEEQASILRDRRGRRLLSFVLLAGTALATPALADDFPAFGPIGGTYNSVTALSADGTVVVGYSSLGAGVTHAIRWTAEGGPVDLGTLGGTTSIAYGLSADGAAVAGNSDLSGDAATHAFRWTSGGGMVDLGTLGGANSYATALSADGAAVVGYSNPIGALYHAFRWTSADGMIDLGALGGTYGSFATSVSADGAVVAGNSYLSGNIIQHAFRWTSADGMIDLGTLGGTNSNASAVSGDGTAVVGSGYLAGDTAYHAFRWTSAGGMADLGTLGGTISSPNALSADGTVVVGNSYLSGNIIQHAFRWTLAGSMADLGTLGGTQSFAGAVSADGAVVVGMSTLSGTAATRAFRWTAATGMRSVQDLLTASGVDVSGWNLIAAGGISADGKVIVGFGSDGSGTYNTWIARCGAGCGLITADGAARSFGGLGAMGQTGNAWLSGQLDPMNAYAREARDRAGRTSPFSVFASGFYDSDPSVSASLGLTYDLPGDVVLGATLGVARVQTDLAYNGSSDFTGGSASAFLAYAPQAGLQVLAGLSGGRLDGTVKRGYLNGNSQAFSSGDTQGRAIAGEVRLGWAFDNVMPATRLTPYGSYTLASTHYDGWSETTGAFPASFAAFTDTAQTTRLGLDARYAFASGAWMTAGAAWGHRLDGGEASIAGSIDGVFAATVPGATGAQDWAELSAGLRVPVAAAIALNGEVTGILPSSGSASVRTRLGVTMAF